MVLTDVSKYAVSEIRAIARRNSRSGMEADAQSVARASADHAAGVAELDRDIGVLMPRWTGDAATATLAVMRNYVKASYLVDRESAGVGRRLTGLATTAGTTNEKFSDLAEPGIEWRDLKIWDRHNDSAGAQVAAEFRSTYSTPVQADASEMPLAETTRKVSFEMPDGGPVRRRGDANEPESGGGGGGEAGGGGGGTDGGGDQATESDGATGAAPLDTTADEASDSAGSESTTGADDAKAAGTGAGTGAGAGTGQGTGAGAGSEQAQPDLGGTTEDAGYEPFGSADETISPLLTPAASVPSSSVGRGGAGLSGVGGRGGGSVASPLGLRQDSAVARTTATPAGTALPSSGARATGTSGGMPPAGAGGQRGKDGRHRVPAYLIDRANGEEVVGEMPLVGPSVIGQWRNEDPPRPPGPPGPPRPR